MARGGVLARSARALRRGVVLLIGAAVLMAVMWHLWVLACLVWWKWMPVESTAFMRREAAALREKDPKAELKHRWVDFERISPHLGRAVIAAEDANFPDHEGVDWEAIEKAYDKNSRKGKVVAGGSTITMQLAKNLFLSPDRSYIRKAEEVIITYMMEAVLDKRRILEIYLNSVEWGVGVFGAEAAARHHYGISAAQLNSWQAARLAAMLPRPKFYDRNRGSGFLARRAAAIQRFMGDVELP